MIDTSDSDRGGVCIRIYLKPFRQGFSQGPSRVHQKEFDAAFDNSSTDRIIIIVVVVSLVSCNRSIDRFLLVCHFRPARDFVLAFHEDAPSANGEIDSLVTRRLLTAWRWLEMNRNVIFRPFQIYLSLNFTCYEKTHPRTFLFSLF